MKIENGYVILEPEELVKYGPGCVEHIHTNTCASWLTHAIAWCYEDWCAQRRMDDDGMAQRVWP